MNRQTGLESLIQRGRTPLFEEMISAFQKMEHALTELPGSSDSDIEIALKNSKFAHLVEAAVSKHTGFKISTVTIYFDNDPNLYCHHTVFKLNPKYLENISTGAALDIINRLYNDQSGTIAGSFPGGIIKIEFHICAVFWKHKDNQGNLYFTPEELAAMLLHELGHVDYFVRAEWRINQTLVDSSEIVKYVNHSQNRQVILDLISKLDKSSKLDNYLKSILSMVKNYFTNNQNIDDPRYSEALSTLSYLVASDTAQWVLEDITWLEDKVKRSVQLITKNHSLDMERSADEYSIRNGTYKYLVSGIIKINQYFLTNLPYENLQMSKFASLTCQNLTKFKSLLYWPAESLSSSYDPLIRRLRLIVETAKHAFHDPKLSKTMQEEIKSQIQEAESFIDKYETSSLVKMRQTLRNWKEQIIKGGSIIALPFRDRLKQDYGRLQDSTRSLSRHVLYYLAKK